MSAISSTVKPCCSLSGPGSGAVRSSLSRVVGGVSTNPPSLRPIREVNRGKRVRATSGIDASTPTAPASRAPKVRDRLPTWNWCDASPSARLVLSRNCCDCPSRRNGFLDDPVPGPDHRRAERHEVGIVHAPIIHRDREEAGRAECGRVRGQLFQVAADRFFALVDAEDRLEPRLRPGIRLSTANSAARRRRRPACRTGARRPGETPAAARTS